MSDLIDTYKTIENKLYFEFEEEKSLFITNAKYVDSESHAIEFIEEIKARYKDASHNCYAYIINQVPEVKRYSDDGEPQGSAGLPMLSVLEKEEAKNIVVIATRYFGGKKLGKGGLVRAYTRAVAEALKTNLVYKSPFYGVKLTHAYTILGQIENFLNEKRYKIIDKEFEDVVKISIYIRREEYEEFKNKLIDMTSANIKIEIIEEKMLFDN